MVKMGTSFSFRELMPVNMQVLIRNEKALDKVRKYIENNPDVEKLNWDELDK